MFHKCGLVFSVAFLSFSLSLSLSLSLFLSFAGLLSCHAISSQNTFLPRPRTRRWSSVSPYLNTLYSKCAPFYALFNDIHVSLIKGPISFIFVFLFPPHLPASMPNCVCKLSLFVLLSISLFLLLLSFASSLSISLLPSLPVLIKNHVFFIVICRVLSVREYSPTALPLSKSYSTLYPPGAP